MRRLTAYLLIAAITVAVSACSDGKSEAKDLGVNLEPNAPAEVKALVEVAWPKVMRSCPGLSKFSPDLTFAGLEDNFAYAPENTQRIDFKFKVDDKPSAIPPAYRAQGHTCYFSVSRDGGTLAISKSPCSLGPVYGAQWIDWHAYREIDQARESVVAHAKGLGFELIAQNPDTRVGIYRRRINQLEQALHTLLTNPTDPRSS